MLYYYLCVAAEYRTFLLYYAPSALFGIITEKYLIHLLLLTKSMRILLADSISEEALELANHLLTLFSQLHLHYYDMYGI